MGQPARVLIPKIGGGGARRTRENKGESVIGARFTALVQSIDRPNFYARRLALRIP
jgi:hypothetical protein